MITKKKAQEILEVLDELRELYFKGREKDYPYSEWERKRKIVKQRLSRLPEYIERAAGMLVEREKGAGRPQKLELTKKVTLFLFTRLLTKTNRGMESLLSLFQPLFDFDVSYKFIERLYSDEEVKLVLHNLFILLLSDEKVSGNFSGDGTGYSLAVTRHYRSNPKKKGRAFVYEFKIMDLDTGMYVGFGYSRKSEKEAFLKAVSMLEKFDIEIDSISLDKYHSNRKVIELFGKKVNLYILPKRNLSKIGICWSRILRKIIEDPVKYLARHFMRNLSESGFSSDKRRFGWILRQKRDDRQEMALFSNALLHNFYAVRISS